MSSAKETSNNQRRNSLKAKRLFVTRSHNLYTGAWCAERKYTLSQSKTQYLQMDLMYPRKIGKIGTQGQHIDGPYNNWVTSYAVRYSVDGKTWTQYPEVQFTQLQNQGFQLMKIPVLKLR